jgi:hypothetical protein
MACFRLVWKRAGNTIKAGEEGGGGGEDLLTTEYTEWQWPLSGVDSFMMEKIAQAFTTSTIAYKVVVYAPAERADSLPLFLLYLCMYSVLLTSSRKIIKK